MAAVFIMVFVVGFTAVFTYSSLSGSAKNEAAAKPVSLDKVDKNNDGIDDNWQAQNKENRTKLDIPDITTVLLLGLDKNERLSDVILIGLYDAVNQKVDIISVPRDTYTVLPKDQVKAIKDMGHYVPSSGVMKLNELHSYAGKKEGHKFSEAYIEGMFDIQFDYYVEVNLSAFKHIVDAMGGIYMDVPGKGMKYDDPEQNLHIRVPGGYQLLDGEKAEGVVRYRHDYKNGDLDRIAVQQAFMKEFFTQALSKDAVLNNPLAFLSTLVSYVNTDFGIESIPKYLPALDGLAGDSIEFHNTPGNYKDVYYGETKVSYFSHDEAAAKTMVANILLENQF